MSETVSSHHASKSSNLSLRGFAKKKYKKNSSRNRNSSRTRDNGGSDNVVDDPSTTLIISPPISPLTQSSTAQSVSSHRSAIQIVLTDRFLLPPSLRRWKSASSVTSNRHVMEYVAHRHDSNSIDDNDDLTISSQASSLACFAQFFPKNYSSAPSFVPHFAPLLDNITTSCHPNWNEDAPKRQLSHYFMSKNKKIMKSKKKKSNEKKSAPIEEQTKVQSTSPKRIIARQSTAQRSSKASLRALAAENWFPVLDGAGLHFSNLSFAPPSVVRNVAETAVAHRVMTKVQQYEECGKETLHPKALLKLLLPPSRSHPPKWIPKGDLDFSSRSSTATASCSVPSEYSGVDEKDIVLSRVGDVSCSRSNAG